MIDVMEIHFDEDEGHLWLGCGDEEFTHLRDLVVSGTSAADQFGPLIDGIPVDRLTGWPRSRRRHRGSSAGDFQILLMTLVLSASVGIQIIGIIAVARWLLERGP